VCRPDLTVVSHLVIPTYYCLSGETAPLLTAFQFLRIATDISTLLNTTCSPCIASCSITHSLTRSIVATRKSVRSRLCFKEERGIIRHHQQLRRSIWCTSPIKEDRFFLIIVLDTYPSSLSLACSSKALLIALLGFDVVCPTGLIDSNQEWLPLIEVDYHLV
jgi:hypothetical protein